MTWNNLSASMTRCLLKWGWSSVSGMTTVFPGAKNRILLFPVFFTGYPFDGEKANAGNGVMTAFVLENSAMIDRLYAIAMREGGSDDVGNLDFAHSMEGQHSWRQ